MYSPQIIRYRPGYTSGYTIYLPYNTFICATHNTENRLKNTSFPLARLAQFKNSVCVYYNVISMCVVPAVRSKHSWSPVDIWGRTIESRRAGSKTVLGPSLQ